MVKRCTLRNECCESVRFRLLLARIQQQTSTPTSHMFVVHVNCISGLRLAPSWLLAQLEASVFVRYRFPGEAQTTSSTPVRLDTSAPSVGAIELHCVHEHHVLVAPEETLHQKLLERRADIVFQVLVISGASEHLVGRTLLPLQMLLATVQQQRRAPSLHLFVRPSPPLLPPLPGSTACELDVALDHRVALAPPTSPPQAAATLVVLVDNVSGLQKALESDLNASVDIALLLPGHEPQIRSTNVLRRTLEPRFRHSERFLLSPSEATLVGAYVEFRVGVGGERTMCTLPDFAAVLGDRSGTTCWHREVAPARLPRRPQSCLASQP